MFHADTSEPEHPGLIWASRILLFYGVALILAGIIFFVAYNLDDLTGLSKLMLAQAAILGCAAASTAQRLSATVRNVLKIAAATLIGAFLAVFGQVYQTGADAWQLFAAWTVLMVPFIVLARSQGGWLLFTIVASIGASLYWQQTPDAVHPVDNLETTGVAFVWGVVWFGLEWWRARGGAWLQSLWTRGAFALFTFSPLIVVLFYEDMLDVPGHVVLTMVVAAVLVARFSLKTVDRAVLAVVGLNLLVLVLGKVGAALIDEDIYIMFLVLTLIALAGTAGLVSLLRRLGAEAEVVE